MAGPIVIRQLSQSSPRGILQFGAFRFPCALGRAGVRAMKREGDGATPQGVFGIRGVFYNAQNAARPTTHLSLSIIGPDDGWCDAVGNRNYNRPVQHPYEASAERMVRSDALYDVVVVLDYNIQPRVQGLGSAIFMHVARTDYEPTEGCIALAMPHLRRLLAHLRPTTRVLLGR